jgi:methyl-accepting chemotaxis protein
VTNQRVRTRVEDVEDVEDTVEDIEDTIEDVGDIIVDTVYLKEGKVVEESVTRSYLTRRIILRTLGLSLRIIQRIVLTMINMPSIGRKVITR